MENLGLIAATRKIQNAAKKRSISGNCAFSAGKLLFMGTLPVIRVGKTNKKYMSFTSIG
jgi:hypothetical protein